MTDRYGNACVTKIKDAIDELRKAIRKEGTQDIQDKWDRFEPWLDVVYERGDK